MASSGPQFDDLYREIILDHYRRPRNKGTMEGADIDIFQHNPLCGDEVRLFLTLKDGRIDEVEFTGQGCSISQSSASMMTEALKGKELAEAEEMAETFRRMVMGAPPPNEEALGDLAALQGVSKFPVRVKCAVLGWDTFQQGLKQYREKVRKS